jgi:hypothetical protein
MALVLFLTATLIISTLGMLSILWLKRYELRTGNVVFAGVRPSMRSFFRRGLFWVERVLPNLVEHEVRRGWVLGRATLRTGIARALLLIEQWLERGLASLRRATTHAPHTQRDASPFLREVVEHKKKLQEDRADDE